MTAAFAQQYQNKLADAGYEPLTSIDQTNATFGEGAAASFRFMRDEGLSTSKGRAFQPYLDARDDEIEKLAGERTVLPFGALEEPWYPEALEMVTSGEMGVDDSRQLTTLSPRARALSRRISPEYLKAIAVRERLRRQYPDRVLSDEQIQAKVGEELKAKREANQSVMARASGGSQFVGTAAGAMTDPAVLATLPLGAGWQAGRMLPNAARAFGSEFLVGAASEAVIQGEVYDFKKSIESPYTKAEAILNVVAAGVGSGVLRATVGAGIDAGIALRSALQREGAREALVRAGIDPEIALRIADEVETRAASKPPDVSLQAHSEAVDRAVTDVGEGRLPDVETAVAAARFAEDQATVREASEFLNVRAADLTADAGNRLNRGERQALLNEVRSVETRLNAAQSDTRLRDLVEAEKADGLTGKKAKAAANKAQEREVAAIQDELVAIRKLVERDDTFRAAEAELSRLEQGRLADPVETAVKYGFKDPRPMRMAVRELIDAVRNRPLQNSQPFDADRAAAEIRAQRVAAETSTLKPKVDKGKVPDALRPPETVLTAPQATAEIPVGRVIPPEPPPSTAGPAAAAPVPPALTLVKASDELPDVKVAVGEREDGTLDVRPVKELLAEIDAEMAALDRIDACLLKEAA